MSVKFQKKPGSIKIGYIPPTYEESWVSAGIYSSLDVRNQALALTPPQVIVDDTILFRQDLDIDEKGHKIFEIRVPYEATKREVGEYTFRYSTTGGNFHIRYSKETVNSFVASGDTAPTFNQAINVKKHGSGTEIDGEDIVIPALKLTYSFRHPLGVINEAFARQVARLTSRVNSDIWHGFAAGELLFLGGEGGDGSNSEADATYEFAAESNISELVIGAIEDIAKDGHDLLWVYWEDDVADDQLAVKPKAVYVERVYDRIAYNSAFAF